MDTRIKRIAIPINDDEVRIIKVRRLRTRTNRADFTGNGHWKFPDQLGANGEFGFIYVIRNLMTGRCYLGKKQFYSTGKLNKGLVTNWQWYISSSKELSEEIKSLGKDDFEFVVLEHYKNRGTLGYAETWSLMHAETPTNREMWYNMLVNKVSWPVKEPITDRHKERLQKIIDGDPIDECIGNDSSIDCTSNSNKG